MMFVVAQEMDHSGPIFFDVVCYPSWEGISFDELSQIYLKTVPVNCDIAAVNRRKYESNTGFHQLHIDFEPFLQTKFYDFYAYKILKRSQSDRYADREKNSKKANMVWTFKGSVTSYLFCRPLKPMDIANILQEQKIMAIACALQQ